jgi:hypothetical protein
MNDCKCPIPGCNYRYKLANVGWYKHVSSVSNHPTWYPDVVDASSRIEAYRRDFPSWFHPLTLLQPNAPPIPLSEGTIELLARQIANQLIESYHLGRSQHPSGLIAKVADPKKAVGD